MAITRPVNLTKRFADSAGAGYVRDIPEASQISINPGAWSLTDGAPPANFLDETLGGVYMSGEDMNGMFRWLSHHIAFAGSGGKYRFDAALSTAIGGYPVGAVLQNNAGTQEYINNTAGNTTNFNTTPSSIGVTWMPHAGIKQLMLVSDEKAAGTSGGNAVLGNNIRDLNTVGYNSIVGASLASNQITLPAGSYLITCRVPGFGAANTKASLYNVTDTAQALYGTTLDCLVVISDPAGNSTGFSFIEDVLTISATKVFEVRHVFDDARTDGLGKAYTVSTRPEIYTKVKIEKLA